MSRIYYIIGKRIASRRIKNNYSQEYLAEITNLHRNYIGYIERGEKHASLAIIQRIAIALNITLEELFKDL